MIISEEALKTIVKSVMDYFHKFEIGDVKVFPSYLGDGGSLPSYDYTGIIHLSGEYKGVVYFSASSHLIFKIISKLGYEKATESYLDLVGEMSNIFAGNLRRTLGKEFNISPPTAIAGSIKALKIDISERPCIIPIEYDGQKSIIVIFFDKT